MRRIFLPALIAITTTISPVARADSIELREIRELKQIVELQSKQIAALTQQVAKISEKMDGKKTAAASNAVPGTEPPGATPPAESAPDAEPEARRTEAVPKHTVAKGETLTAIAKLYNITVSDLLKLNKIENDRKLQIGQTLTIPAPKPTETPAEKKENP